MRTIDSADDERRPPSGGPCADQATKALQTTSHIALLSEGCRDSTNASINMALLTEGGDVLFPVD